MTLSSLIVPVKVWDKSEGVMAPLGPIVATPVVEFYVHINEQTLQQYNMHYYTHAAARVCT